MEMVLCVSIAHIIIHMHICYVSQIVQHCEEGNFRMAHDVYLRGAIGNSAWPIGLTMVGIHERSGKRLNG